MLRFFSFQEMKCICQISKEFQSYEPLHDSPEFGAKTQSLTQYLVFFLEEIKCSLPPELHIQLT